MNNDLLLQEDEDIINETYHNKKYNEVNIFSKSISYIDFTKVELIKSTFTNIQFDKVDFTNCDLSNTEFIDCSFRDIKINNCKLVGTEFVDCHFTDSEITNSQCKYINIVDSKLKNTILNDSDLNEGTFNNVELNKVNFNNINFQQFEFIDTLLNKIDLSSCDIRYLRTTPKCLRGAIIDCSQSIDLINLLGLVIKEN